VTSSRSSWLRPRLAEIFGLDLRSLALFRVALAACARADLSIRSTHHVAHYTDAGIAPRSDLVDEFAFLHDRAFSFHLMAGSAATEALLFAIAAVAAAALLVGFRTRSAAVVLWALTSSLQLRNLYVGAGYDALLRMLLLWSCFLPLGARASLDAARDPPRGGRTDAARPYVSVGSVALIVQLAIVFFVAGYGKWLQPSWQDGGALARIFADDMRVTALGAALRGHVAATSALTRVVPWLEMLAPVALLSPIAQGPIRTALVFGLAAMAAGFGATLHVGLFPFVTAAGVSALLPGWFWDVAWQRLRRLFGRPARSPEPAGTVPRRSPIGEGICAVLLAFVVFWNVGPMVSENARMPRALEEVGRALFLQQAWQMFAEPATRTGWLVMAGKLRSSRAVDLFVEGGPAPDLASASRPVPWDGPPSFGGSYANDRWRNFFDRAVRGTGTQRRLNLYGRYLCRTWNGAHTGDDELTVFELWWVAADVAPNASLGAYERKLIWSHDCFS
jgi:hypothetical protein